MKPSKMEIIIDDMGYFPEHAHKYDAGYDLKSPVDVVVRANDSAFIDTLVHVRIPKGYVGFLMAKSGLNSKHNITSTGTIDCGYTGSIKVKLRNHGNDDYMVHRGDKITQLVLLPIITPRLVEVSHFPETDRGNGGFGSTGK